MDINSVAMKVILHAGNAREYIDEALDLLVTLNFLEATKSIELAEAEILKAHNSQTKVIQQQAAGDNIDYSLLFIHAQDTMMTINTELRLTKKFLPILKTLYNQIEGEEL